MDQDKMAEVEFSYKEARMRVRGSESFIETVFKNHNDWFGRFLELIQEYDQNITKEPTRPRAKTTKARLSDSDADWVKRIADDSGVSHSLIQDVFEEKDGLIYAVDWTKCDKPSETRKQMVQLVVYANNIGLGAESVARTVVQESLRHMAVDSKNPPRDFLNIEGIRTSGQNLIINTPGKKIARELLKNKQGTEEVYHNE